MRFQTMRRYLFFATIAISLIGCFGETEKEDEAESVDANSSATSSMGSDNALKFVIYEFKAEDADSTHVQIDEHVLSDDMIARKDSALMEMYISFCKGKMELDEFESEANELADILEDVNNSIDRTADTESLEDKYNDWRRVYKVSIWKSKKKRTFRVVMEDDGNTPRCLDTEYKNDLGKYEHSLQRYWREIQAEKRYRKTGKYPVFM